MRSTTARPAALIAAALLALAAGGLTSTAVAASPSEPDALTSVTPGPVHLPDPTGTPEPTDDPAPPEPQVPPGPGNLAPCFGHDAEGQVVDTCDHPGPEAPPRATVPVDPCRDVPEEEVPPTSIQVPAPGGDDLTVTAPPADCEPPDDEPPSFTG